MRENGNNELSLDDMASAADRLFYAMRRARSISTEESGLTLPQLALLAPLAGDELPVSKLAANADVSVPAATRMLKHLESKGIVTRHRSPADERQVLVTLTEEGAERLAAIRGWMRERQARTYASFTPAERAQLIALFDRVTESIVQASQR